MENDTKLSTLADSLAKLELPPLYCPIPVTVHPHADEIDARAVDWMGSFSFPQDPVAKARLLGSRSAAYVANCSPHAPDEERLEIGGRLYLFGFAIDDWIESQRSLDDVVDVCCRLQRLLEDPDAGLFDAPFIPPWLELAADFRRLATAAQFQRFVAGFRLYYQSLPWEASHRLRGRVPDLNTHPAIRYGVAGVQVFHAALEIYNIDEIPEREWADPAVIAFRETVGLLLAWANDLGSFAKDILEGDGGETNNLVNVLMAHSRRSPKYAVPEAINIWNRVMLLALELRKRLMSSGSQPLQKFLADATSMVGNVISWQSNNPRYAMIARALPITVEPPAGLDHTPLPIPSIAWWWKV